MPPPKNTHDLARSLVARETDPGTSSLQAEPATVRVYERLRRQLGTPVGVDGFQALAARALALAKVEAPRLSDVQLTANGGLRGFSEMASQIDADEGGEAGILLIAQLLGLFLAFLGEATTLRLLEDLRVQGEDSRELAPVPESGNFSVADDAVVNEAFEDLLLEIDRLRSVSERIEALAAKQPGMEEGLVSVAGSIRNIASVLDVFTLIRSRAGGQPDEFPDLQKPHYMN